MLTPHRPHDNYDARLDTLVQARHQGGRWQRWGLWLLGAALSVPAILGFLTLLPSLPQAPAPPAPSTSRPAPRPAVQAPGAARRAMPASVAEPREEPRRCPEPFISAPAGALGTAVRLRGLGELAQRQQWVRLCNDWVNLRNPVGLQIAMQYAAQIPEVRRAWFLAARALAGGDMSLGIQLYAEAWNIYDLREATKRYQAEEARPAGTP